MSIKVKNIGEQGLLARLQKYCPTSVIGDDGAVFNHSPDKSLVVTTDLLVDGVHFSDSTTSPEDVGFRSATANLSDLAAMGASPLGITIGLSLPGDVTVEWVEKLYQGLNSCLQKYNTQILGGDICRSSVITVAITAFGEVNPGKIISRFVAQPGDAIVVTGNHGCAKAGLELLIKPEIGQKLSLSEQKKLIQSHRRPLPRLDCLSHLHNLFPDNWCVAGMDSSDGLADAVIQICRCSDVGAEIDRKALEIPTSLTKLVSPEEALNWVLYGGEDYELVLALPQPQAETLVKKLGKDAAIIGKIIEEKTVKVIDNNDPESTLNLSLAAGYQHFA